MQMQFQAAVHTMNTGKDIYSLFLLLIQAV